MDIIVVSFLEGFVLGFVVQVDIIVSSGIVGDQCMECHQQHQGGIHSYRACLGVHMSSSASSVAAGRARRHLGLGWLWRRGSGVLGAAARLAL